MYVERTCGAASFRPKIRRPHWPPKNHGQNCAAPQWPVHRIPSHMTGGELCRGQFKNGPVRHVRENGPVRPVQNGPVWHVRENGPVRPVQKWPCVACSKMACEAFLKFPCETSSFLTNPWLERKWDYGGSLCRNRHQLTHDCKTVRNNYSYASHPPVIIMDRVVNDMVGGKRDSESWISHDLATGRTLRKNL